MYTFWFFSQKSSNPVWVHTDVFPVRTGYVYSNVKMDRDPSFCFSRSESGISHISEDISRSHFLSCDVFSVKGIQMRVKKSRLLPERGRRYCIRIRNASLLFLPYRPSY